mmetsp:Transcript_4726/g.6697  ORF Transcript_4726/g.6697 Transcript_4726/m.6697 type:complete len:247 (+) Transcript_4726:48-788(+)
MRSSNSSKKAGRYAPVPQERELEMQSLGDPGILSEEDLEEIEARRDTRWRTRAAGAGLLCLSLLSLALLGASWRPDPVQSAKCSLKESACPCESAIKLTAKVSVSQDTKSSVQEFMKTKCATWQAFDPPEIELACSCDPHATLQLSKLDLSLSGEVDCLSSSQLCLPLDRASQSMLSDNLEQAGVVLAAPFVASPFAVSMGTASEKCDDDLPVVLAKGGKALNNLRKTIQAAPSISIIIDDERGRK